MLHDWIINNYLQGILHKILNFWDHQEYHFRGRGPGQIGDQKQNFWLVVLRFTFAKSRMKFDVDVSLTFTVHKQWLVSKTSSGMWLHLCKCY